mgnify:CR=1 FL=1
MFLLIGLIKGIAMRQFSKDFVVEDTKLFKQVASVIGKEKALEELLKGLDSYNHSDATMMWDWNKRLVTAFEWCETEQGQIYWANIDRDITYRDEDD